MSFFPDPPSGFAVASIQITPVPKVTLVWDEYTIVDDILHANDFDELTATPGINPARISAHNREVVGYELWRALNCNFTPPEQGSLLADETTLLQTTLEYEDTDVVPNQVYWYKLAAKIHQ